MNSLPINDEWLASAPPSGALPAAGEGRLPTADEQPLNEANYEEQQGQDPATLRRWPLMLPSERAARSTQGCAYLGCHLRGGGACSRTQLGHLLLLQARGTQAVALWCMPPITHGCHESIARCHFAATAARTFGPAGQPTSHPQLVRVTHRSRQPLPTHLRLQGGLLGLKALLRLLKRTLRQRSGALHIPRNVGRESAWIPGLRSKPFCAVLSWDRADSRTANPAATTQQTQQICNAPPSSSPHQRSAAGSAGPAAARRGGPVGRAGEERQAVASSLG